MKAILVKRMGKVKASGKLAKPEVEKFRRERINNSLENLRVMLLHCPEHQDLAGRRVEKVEILEHTVTFLKGHDGRRGKGGNVEQQFQDGYSACLRKAADFLRNFSQTGDQRGFRTQRIAPAVQLFTHLQKLTAAPPNPTPPFTERETTPDLNQNGQPAGLMAVQRQPLSSLPKLSPRAHSARPAADSPSLISSQALWRPWP
ncbi:hypothetical protein ACEWY4_026655 [Coilia grayii]|uniref:BHLH domain-containing protein n=1 Tax=Coilia grayii TaxID=363190 RepID=A0ABD1IT74_9TELE